MKKYLILCLLCLLAGGCGDDETYDTTNIILTDEGQLSILVSEKANFLRIEFRTLEPWRAWMINPGDGWCSIYPGEGPAGDHTLRLQMKENRTGADRGLTLILRAGSSRRDIQVKQIGKEQLNLAKNSFEIGPKAGTFEVVVESNARLTLLGSGLSAPWLTHTLTTSPGRDGLTKYTYSMSVTDNPSDESRGCYLRVKGFNLTQTIQIRQAGQADPAYYESTDFSSDEKIVRLQQATEGNGIDLVFLGDAFSDRLIRNGEYDTWMRTAMEAFFAIEPYASLRDRFDVWYVNAVSRNQSYIKGGETALKCSLKSQSQVEGDDKACRSYVLKIPNMTPERLDNTLAVVVLNTQQYAGTTYMYAPTQPNDHASGFAVSYCAKGGDKMLFTRLLQHEAGGHGFAKLADEYNDKPGSIPDSEKSQYQSGQSLGWYRNIDFTPDPQAVKWHRFLADPAYRNEELGVFEGAGRYERGAFRPKAKQSMMRDNNGNYNAPSREAIYYRINKLSYGNAWRYDYRKFVAFDQSTSLQTASRASSASVAVTDTAALPHTPPVICTHPL